MNIIKLCLLLAFLALPASLFADACTDACDLDFLMATEECLDALVFELLWCDEDHGEEIEDCDDDYDQCLADCQGDPDCEYACYVDQMNCYDEADAEHNYCIEQAHSEHYQCEQSAENVWIACYADCEGTPVHKRDWGQVKSLYR